MKEVSDTAMDERSALGLLVSVGRLYEYIFWANHYSTKTGYTASQISLLELVSTINVILGFHLRKLSCLYMRFVVPSPDCYIVDRGVG